MQRAAQAYGAVAKQTANPRELEADLLLSAAARLQAIHDGWDAKFPELDAALVYNRKLWSIFVTSATSPRIRCRQAFGKTSPIWACSSSITHWRSWLIRGLRASAR